MEDRETGEKTTYRGKPYKKPPPPVNKGQYVTQVDMELASQVRKMAQYKRF